MLVPILFVDDEPNILAAVRRQLKGKYDLSTADSGKEGIELIKNGKHFAVVVSDYKMPLMNGAEFLMKVKELSPSTIRVMLTGQADMEAIIKIINEGQIFRFLSKPCSPELLIKNIDDAVEQYRLVHAEKELLSKTLSGTMQIMTDILALAKPEAFNRGIRIREIVKKILKFINIENSWQIEIAAMLSQIGCVTIPDSILTKIYKNLPVSEEDRALYILHAKTSSDIIKKIPRLEHVAKIIFYQEKYYNGTGFPADSVKEEQIPLGARAIKLALDYDQLLQKSKSEEDAVSTIKERQGWYDEKLVKILENVILSPAEKIKFILKQVKIDELNDNMYLGSEIVSASGVIIGSAKQRITKTLVITLKNYFKNHEITEPISVLTIVD